MRIKQANLLYNNACVVVDYRLVVDKNLTRITAKQMLQLFNNKEYIELTYKSVNGLQFFMYNEALNNTQDVYINGDEVDIPAEYSGNTKYVMVHCI